MSRNNFYNFNIDKWAIGVDLVEVNRFIGIEKRTQFMKNIFTAKELKQCKKENGFNESLAGRFAAKEAIRKTVKENVKFNKLEIVSGDDGAPMVNFLDPKMKKKYKSLISIAHTKQLAQAVCLTVDCAR